MKRRFTIHDLRFAIWKKSAATAAVNRQSSIINHQSQRGVALVITVILLAVVTFMAITFLAVSRREREAVTTTTDTTTAQLASDDALAAAEAQIVANTLATTNPYNFGLLVSTNYINPLGFTPGSASPTNVNYDYLTATAGGGPLPPNDFLQNLANLYYSPRAPVYATNLIYNRNELQYYLDLNRNGLAENSGLVTNLDNQGIGMGTASFQVGDPDWIGVLQHPDQPYGPNNLFVARYAFVAVPVGNTLDLNAIYNEAITRQVRPNYYDIGTKDGFMRNQGVGAWEINLAAFLADLNTNAWGQIVGSGNFPPAGSGNWYQYNEGTVGGAGPFQNQGVAFDDALSLLSYRYNYNYYTLAPVAGFNPPGLFTSAPTLPAFRDNIDYYSDGQPPMTSPAGINVFNQNVTWPWAGADNTNRFFDLQDLFNSADSSPAFTNRLTLAQTGPSTYNRYTYYRLLAQMGVDSVPEQDRINLNYANAFATFDQNGVATNITYIPNGQTNLAPWTPLQFFTVAADKMLRAYSQEWLAENPSNYVVTYGMTTNISTAANPLADPTNIPIPFGISDIPVLISNRFVYTPAVQRVLQLAANIYDATTNTSRFNVPDYPSVFRPIFLVTNNPDSGYTDVYIKGYEPVQTLVNGVEQIGAVTGPNDPQFNLPVEVRSLSPGSTAPDAWEIYTNLNVYGVPWIIGAKKGFPNFNEFSMESVFQLTRKVEATRPSTNSAPSEYHFYQMFNLSISNQVGVECWNSYTNDFLKSVDIYVTDVASGQLMNDEGFSNTLGAYITGHLTINSASNNNNGWPGYNPDGSGAPHSAILLSPASFQMPLETNVTIVTNSTYRFYVGGTPYLTTNLSLNYEENVSGYPQPHWLLSSTNNVRVIILDTTVNPNRVIDYVQLSGPNSSRDLTSEIITNYDKPVVSVNASGDELWNTNFQAGVPIAILSQVGVSLDNYSPSASSGTWDLNNHDTQNGIDAFRVFYDRRHLSPIWNNPSGQQQIAAAYMTNSMALPYQPTATVVEHIDWQANDPLVHYLAGDLNWSGAVRLDRTTVSLTAPTNSSANLGKLNKRYMPWGGYPEALKASDFSVQNAYNMALKDPLVWRSDDWDFPTYKLPTIGWLGRVHRGTPWQTVYLKSPDILQEIQTRPGGTDRGYGTNTWRDWTGNTRLTYGQYYDAANAAPVQDRLLLGLFSTAPSDNATRGQLSVNVDASNPSPQAGLAAWSALFSGIQVLSNDVVVPMNQHNGSMGDFTSVIADPAGPAGTNSPLGRIVLGINRTRRDANNTARITWINKTGTATNEIPATFKNANGLAGTFEHVGDILSVPQLSDESPFLNWNNTAQLHGGISDEMYEWLPQQVLSLLRASGTPQSPMRYVIYSYGQALKPAPNSIYTGSGPFFGMVTNYQVVAESATRAIVNFGSVLTNIVTVTNDYFGNRILVSRPAVTNNTAQIEQFNVLPPY